MASDILRGDNEPKIYGVLVVVLSLHLSVVSGDPGNVCPDFTATFVAVLDQDIDFPTIIPDSEYTFFKEILGFRDDDIQHAFEDALKFFNETYGLDFSVSQPNEQNEYLLGNTRMIPFTFHEDYHFQLALSNWIQTGNTRFSCREIHVGGFCVFIGGERRLFGDYGGINGKLVGAGSIVEYGFYRIDVCDQSPVILTFKTATPIRQESVDGIITYNFDIYNNVLGHGKALGSSVFTRYPDNPTKYRSNLNIVHTFPAN